MIRTVALSTALFIGSMRVWAADISVENPWMREAPPSAKALAGYMVIKANHAKTVKLKKAESPAFEKIEFHITVFEGGMMRMMHLESLEITPDEPMEFEPAGKHLMLINPTRKFKAGDSFPVKITLENGETVDVAMEVRK